MIVHMNAEAMRIYGVEIAGEANTAKMIDEKNCSGKFLTAVLYFFKGDRKSTDKEIKKIENERKALSWNYKKEDRNTRQADWKKKFAPMIYWIN